ncbi:hypothetical protein [Epilithonimonas xixisoli]|uniref:Uncharacterized protein n=1 Tax=Epilithonimonas xixisoli TaxID=1476462 RepID=A0A4R8I6P5_9FLAO|nr:hypothetical protein [Epilithonimonas xixisoli]TDX84055.1 hypothetical protein B0I22_1649 [Epilithonimonas xixisoli]
MLQTIFISQKYFTKEELSLFKEKFGYQINEISYSSSGGEVDFADENEKTFLLEKGYPKILARFFA